MPCVLTEVSFIDHPVEGARLATDRYKRFIASAIYRGIRKYFESIMALEDCLEEEARLLKAGAKKVSLSKPDPFMLDAIAERHKDFFTESYYIGDMPDDMIAAKNSETGYKAVGMIMSAPDRASLKKELGRAGADFIIEDFQQLKEFVRRS